MTQEPTSRGSNGNHPREVDILKSPPQATESEREALGASFLELEYTTLRKEIEDSRERGFKIIVGAVLAVPTAQFIAEGFNIGIFKLFVPLIVLCFYLLWLAEHLAIGRCAEYILTLEDRMKRISPEVEGWEHWLRARSVDRRTSEKYLGYAIDFLSIGFYGAATLIAASALDSKDFTPVITVLGQSVSWAPLLVLVLYICLGLGATALVSKIPRGWEADRQGERD